YNPQPYNEPADVPYQLNGRRPLVGFIYQAGSQHYIMTNEGLVPIGDVTLAIRLTFGQTVVRQISGAEASDATVSNRPLEPEGYPMSIPERHPANGTTPTICALYRGPTEQPPAVTVEIFDSPPAELD